MAGGLKRLANPNGSVVELVDAIRTALDLRAALEMLRRLEWGKGICPTCNRLEMGSLNYMPGTHAPTCELDALLRKMGG